MSDRSQPWIVEFSGNANKQRAQLPSDIAAIFELLVNELKMSGPQRAGWRNYGRLHKKKNEEYYHCHLNPGKPRYVAIWKVVDRTVRLMEIRYVGTHEKANYTRIR